MQEDILQRHVGSKITDICKPYIANTSFILLLSQIWSLASALVLHLYCTSMWKTPIGNTLKAQNLI